MKPRILTAAAAALLAAVVLALWRHFPARLALTAGIAIGAFVYVLWGTVVNLAALHRTRR